MDKTNKVFILYNSSEQKTVSEVTLFMILRL